MSAAEVAAREVPSSRWLMSQSGLMPVPISQPRNLPVPYAVPATTRLGFNAMRVWVRAIHGLCRCHLVIGSGRRAADSTASRFPDRTAFLRDTQVLSVISPAKNPDEVFGTHTALAVLDKYSSRGLLLFDNLEGHRDDKL